MKIFRYITILLAITTGLTACNKFLDVKPKGLILPEKIGDYEGILNAPVLTHSFPINLLDFTDDVFYTFDPLNNLPTANGYYWRPIITVNESTEPDAWGPLYHSIYDANVIINGVPGAIDGTPEKKQQIMGEALVMRASYYLDLLTVFAKAYNVTSSATDPGVPLVTTTDVTDTVPGRSSVKAVLDTIISNVVAAADMLPTDNINRFRVTKYAAYGLLSRIYLYMADYTNAKKYAEMALQAPHSILDYNSYSDYYEVPVYDLNPEVLWQRASMGTATFILYSEDLKSYFDNTDLRYSFLTVGTNRGVERSSFFGEIGYNLGITFPEMDLTVAEVLAREGNIQGAMDIVNDFRKNRIKTASYTDQTASSGEEALTKVLAERRRELAFSGPRWFDMKRLDQEGRMPQVDRINPDTQAVDASLPPHSPKYTFEIPVRVTQFNPNMETNKRQD